MPQAIIFKNNAGGVSVIYPEPETLALYGIEAIARKDVPVGKPFGIINTSDLPDRAQRSAWDIDEATLADGVGDGSALSEVQP